MPGSPPSPSPAPPPGPRRPTLRDALRTVPPVVLAAVALGGVIGSLARYGLIVAFPPEPGRFDTATFLANAIGGLLIGALMVVVTDLAPDRRLLRPFLGVGVLGGFTTFSTFITGVGRAVDAGAALLAVAYAFATIAAALTGAALGMQAVRRAVARRRR